MLFKVDVVEKHGPINVCTLVLQVLAMFEGIPMCSCQIFRSNLPEEFSPLKVLFGNIFCSFLAILHAVTSFFALIVLFSSHWTICTQEQCTGHICTVFLLFRIYAMAWVIANFKFQLSCYLNLFYSPQDCILLIFNISVHLKCWNKLNCIILDHIVYNTRLIELLI